LGLGYYGVKFFVAFVGSGTKEDRRVVDKGLVGWGGLYTRFVNRNE
jgi:hypothetical protein